MKGTRALQWVWLGWLAVLAMVPLARAQTAGTNVTVLYATGFEASEGYKQNTTLAGQNNWVSEGSVGNGLVTNVFPGFGQQAFVGFSLGTNITSRITVWRPVNYTPLTSKPVVRFTTTMQIFDSTAANGNYDDFRWSIYNSLGDRLFTLNFDNSTYVVSYLLDNATNFVSTGFTFSHDGSYDLEFVMNFARNSWSANMQGTPLVENLPMTRSGLQLDFGDADAVWAIYRSGQPGNNYMVFDNYRITAEPQTYLAPRIESVGIAGGKYALKIHGEPQVKYAIDSSVNLKTWLPTLTNSSASGTVDFIDSTSVTNKRYYRARVVP